MSREEDPLLWVDDRYQKVKLQIECVRSGHVGGETIKNICMKMKFISQRNIALLCYSSIMAAANTLYRK